MIVSVSPTLSHVRLFATPWTGAYQALLSVKFSSGVGCHFLLQGIFLTQGSNPDLLHCRQILYHFNHQGSLTLHKWYLRPWDWMKSHRRSVYIEQKSGVKPESWFIPIHGGEENEEEAAKMTETQWRIRYKKNQEWMMSWRAHKESISGTDWSTLTHAVDMSRRMGTGKWPLDPSAWRSLITLVCSGWMETVWGEERMDYCKYK